MPKIIDLTGKRFGLLVVIGKMNIQKPGNIRWGCRCDCGNVSVVTTNGLNNKCSTSCGCCSRTKRESNPYIRSGLFTGGKCPDGFKSWASMKDRCYNKNNLGYKDYGGRGIKVCQRWRNSFFNFIEDMGSRPSKNHSLDRIRVNGDYKPSNCRWALPIVQGNNRRNNKIIKYKDKSMTVTQWATLLGMNKSTLDTMLRRGNTIDNVFKKYSK